MNKGKLSEEIQMAQEDLRDLETHIEAFYNFLPLAIAVVNPIGIIININRAFENLIRLEPIEVVGLSLSSIFLERGKVEKIAKKVMREKATKTRELTLISREKEKIPVRISVSPREDKEGNLIGYFVGISDIKKIKRYQEELEDKVKERTKELQEKIEELEKFHKLTVGRELKMVELKEEVKKSEEELGKIKGRK